MTFNARLAYRKSFTLSMEIFELTKNFPKEETYSLMDQIRRSSRSVLTNIAEAYAKRRYQKHFISKLTDSDAENLETQCWLQYSLGCNYIGEKNFKELIAKSEAVCKLIHFMINNRGKFGSKVGYN